MKIFTNSLIDIKEIPVGLVQHKILATIRSETKETFYLLEPMQDEKFIADKNGNILLFYNPESQENVVIKNKNEIMLFNFKARRIYFKEIFLVSLLEKNKCEIGIEKNIFSFNLNYKVDVPWLRISLKRESLFSIGYNFEVYYDSDCIDKEYVLGIVGCLYLFYWNKDILERLLS